MSRQRETVALTGALMTALARLLGSGPADAQAPAKKPNVLVIFGDDVGVSNISAYSATCSWACDRATTKDERKRATQTPK